MRTSADGGTRRALTAILACLLLTVPAVAAAATAATADPSKVEASLLAEPDGKQLTFWVTFRAQADLASAPEVDDFADRGELVIDRLQDSADTSQAGVERLLDGQGIDHESFWISNAMRVTGPKKLALELAERTEVERVLSDRTLDIPDPIDGPETTTAGVEWNVAEIRAAEAWDAFGATGEGIVVANVDTGVQFDHPALVARYRGNEGGTFDHNYSWFDPSHGCGNPSVAPCDNAGHGTHTMGTMVGDDGTGASRIGVAPGARWIAAKGCEATSCSMTSLLASGQWLLAPTDLNGQNPRPDLRPNVVNNSWGGGGQNPFFQDIVSSWIAAGMFPVFSNGNSGPTCGTAGNPGNYPDSYAVGAYDREGVIAPFSSRGSTALATVKPDIAAPGVGVRSSVPGGGYESWSGTSMAAPHVAAAVALMWSSSPSLVSDVPATKAILDQTAIDTPALACGGTDGDNGVWGEGRLDAFAAVELSPRGPTGTLSGVVRDHSTSQPVGGARVRSVRAGQPDRVTSTDSTGGYRQVLPVGRYQVVVDGFGYHETRLDADITEDETTVADHALAALPRHAVAGTVVDSDGDPVAGARVSVAGLLLPAQTTDAGGAYRFAALPLGTYLFTVSASGCLGDDSGGLLLAADAILDFVLDRKVDGFGYSCRTVAPAYVEADTVLALNGDDTYMTVPLPFPFSYYGVSYPKAYISTNGVVGLAGGSSSYSNVALPSIGLPNGAIYPYWDDLYVDASASVRTASVGSEPNRRFVVEWRNVSFYSNRDLRIDFEVILDQAGGVRFEYRNVDDNERERGSSATIGLENAAGTVGLGYSNNQSVLSPAATAIRFDTPFTATNRPPDAVADSATRNPAAPVTIDVLANDDDLDGDDVVVTGVSDPAGGTATVNADGTVTYRPDAGFVLPESFTYDVADGRGGTDRALVSLSVAAVGGPPVADDDVAATAEDTPVTVGVLANDHDPDGDPLRVATVSDPAHGTATVNADGTVAYVPDANVHGADSFTYEVDDGFGGRDPATVAVSVSPVNDAPATMDDSVTVLQDSSATIPVLGNDTDVDGDVLGLASVADPSHGVATANADRSVTYRPDAGYSGADSFRYVADDGHGATRPATVTVSVTAKKSIPTPLSVWIYRSVGSLDGLGNWVFPYNEPTATAGQLSPEYAYSHHVRFSDLTASGTISIGTGAAGRTASFAITRADGTSDRVQVPYSWTAGNGYFLMTLHLGGGRWGAYVIHGTTGALTTIGALTVSPQNQTLFPMSVTSLSWSGSPTGDCAAYPSAQSIVLPPTGFLGGVPRTSYNVVTELPAADCAASNLFGGDWAYYGLGAGG